MTRLSVDAFPIGAPSTPFAWPERERVTEPSPETPVVSTSSIGSLIRIQVQSSTPFAQHLPSRQGILVDETQESFIHVAPSLTALLYAQRQRDVLERWFIAWSSRNEVDELWARTTTLHLLRGGSEELDSTTERLESHPETLELNPPSAWHAAEQLHAWLGVTYEQLSDMTGIGTSTFHSWNRSNVAPRPSKVRDLWRLFTLARSLQSSLGASDAAAWLRSGSPSPLELLLARQLTEVEIRARREVVRPIPIPSNQFLGARIEDREYGAPVTRRTSGLARRAARPPRKGQPKARN